jgi:hypothetical protein
VWASSGQKAVPLQDDQDAEPGIEGGALRCWADLVGAEEPGRCGREQGLRPGWGCGQGLHALAEQLEEPSGAVPGAVGRGLGRGWLKPQERVRGVQGVAVPLEHDREVRGFLELDDQHSGADGVRHAGRAQQHVTGPDRHPVGPGEQRAQVLPDDEVLQLVGADVMAEPEVDERVRFGVQDDPRLGLAVRAAKVLACEGPVGVDVQREP